VAGRFEAALDAFGPLPDDARLRLAKELENAWGLTQDFSIDPAKARDHFQKVAFAAENLLGTLFIGPSDIAEAWDERVDLGTALGPVRTAYESAMLERRRSVGFVEPAVLKVLLERHILKLSDPLQDTDIRHLHVAAGQAISLERFIVALADLAAGARNAAAFQKALTQEGRLGSGRKGLLMQHAFTIYALMRHEHPKSGPKIGMGGPLVRFIVAVLAEVGFVGEDATKDVVRGAHKRWKEKHKPTRRSALK
jgi:hypothetical protein